MENKYEKIFTTIKWDTSEVTNAIVSEWKQNVLNAFKQKLGNENLNLDQITFQNGVDGDDFIRNKITYIAFLYADDTGNVLCKGNYPETFCKT